MTTFVGAEVAGRLTPDHVARPTTCDYVAFGGTLRSELVFPELRESFTGGPQWTLRIAVGQPLGTGGVPLGERRVGSETYRLWAIPAGLRLEYSHAGWFDITAGGSQILWYPGADPQPELVRAIVIGPVLALALEAAGSFCLHGSAVAFAGRGVGFLAPKHHGKSTLAVALSSAGAQFVGDDTLAVSPGSPATLRPGIASVRLWEDAARALHVTELCETVIPGVKTTATGFRDAVQVRHAVPLEAVYVLDPVPAADAEHPARRARLHPAAAAVSLAHHTKLPDSLVGIRTAGMRLRMAVAVASTVPVYTLHIARSFTLLPAVVQQLFEWHGDVSAPTGGRSQ
jgi:hypothetical protein